MNRRFRLTVRGIVAAFVAIGVPSVAQADPFQFTIPTTSFLIPVGGQSGRLSLFSDGTKQTGCVPGDPATSCFNALGSQTFDVNARSSSTGHLTLDLYFSGSPLGDPNFIFNSAEIQFTVRDLDFYTDHVSQTVTLREMAIIKAANGEALVAPINLKDYLPVGTTVTDDKTITLRPIDLMPPLEASDFLNNPFILSIGLTATVWNASYSKVRLTNTPESLFAGIRINADVTPKPLPEPTTGVLLLFGVAIAARCKQRGQGIRGG